MNVRGWFTRCAAPTALLLLLPAIVGCGRSGPARHTISGTVRYGEQPIAAGRIVFEPNHEAGNVGPQGIAEIQNGKFSTLSNRGSVGGAVIATIEGHSGEPHPEDPRGLPLFPPYEVSLNVEDAQNVELVVPVDHTFTSPRR